MVRTTAARWIGRIPPLREPISASSSGTCLSAGNLGGRPIRRRQPKTNEFKMTWVNNKRLAMREPASSAFLPLGPGSLLLASAALVAASIPFVRVLALPLSGLGIFVGLLALTSKWK